MLLDKRRHRYLQIAFAVIGGAFLLLFPLMQLWPSGWVWLPRQHESNGVYLMQDIKGSSHVYNNVDHPIGTFLYTISTMHCMTVSLSQGGEGLGAMWGEEKAREYLGKAAFKSIETNQLAHDIQNNWYVVRK